MRSYSALLDYVLVVDVESTCWDDKMSVKPADMKSEIIEIGIASVSPRWKTMGTGPDQMIIKPVESEVSDFCTQLTGWTHEKLADGMSFKEACQNLVDKYNSKRRIWASWGNYDRRQFERQCARQNVRYPFGASHINVKDLFTLKMGLTKTVNVMEALDMLDMRFIGTWHSGADDAFNIARILLHILDSNAIKHESAQNVSC